MVRFAASSKNTVTRSVFAASGDGHLNRGGMRAKPPPVRNDRITSEQQRGLHFFIEIPLSQRRIRSPAEMSFLNLTRIVEQRGSPTIGPV